MATVSLSPQQYQQMTDRIAGLESVVTNLQSHAVSQQEQIRFAELVIQQLSFQGTVEVRGKPSEYHDWAFNHSGCS